MRLLELRTAARMAAALGAVALLVFALGRWTRVDLLLADMVYDRASRTFPWRESWLTVIFGHRIAKGALTLCALALLAAALFDAAWPQPALDGPFARLRLRVIAWSALLAGGLALGWMQQLRGAHFLSHTLWSAWIACAIVLALLVLLQERAVRAPQVSGDAGPRAPAGTRSRAR